MKKLLTLLVVMIFGLVSLWAQTPTLSYQSVVRDENNRLIQNTAIDLTVQILEGNELKYQETRTVTTNQNGVVSFAIGDANRQTNVEELTNVVNWNGATIKVTYHLADGDVVVPTVVTAVPYALQAGNAQATESDPVFTAWDKSYNDLTNKPDINNATLTIKQGETTLGTFTANAAEAVNVTIPEPAAQVQADWTETTTTNAAYIQNKPALATVATSGSYDDLSNKPDLSIYATNTHLNDTLGYYTKTTDLCTTIEANCTNVALKNADNEFTGTNIVPRGFVISGDNATNGTNCNNVVVNACDLWTIFDSLSRRITALEEELDAFKNATPPVFNSISLSEVTTTSLKVTSSFTSPGVDITSYECCYSKNSDMSESTCVTGNESEITLSGLDPYTQYYVTVSATNMLGTATSTVADTKTLANAPTGTVNGTTTTPSGITVTLSSLNFKEPGEGTVQIFYKKKTEATCGTNIADYTALTASETISNGTPYNQTISSLEDETVYCVIVKLQNVDNITYTDPIEVTSGASNEFVITSQYYSDIEDDDIWICRNAPVSVTYTANPLVGDIDDYEDFTWRYYQSDNAAENHYALPTVSSDVADGSNYTITISATSSSHDAISIECTAKHKVTGALIKGKWEDLRTRNDIQHDIPSTNFNVNYLTVTALTSYSKVDWGDGSAVQEGVAYGTEHLYQEEGTYTVTLINIHPSSISTGCIATGTVTVVTPPESIYKCAVTTAHQGTDYENNGYDSGSGAANDGYEETDASGNITSVTDYDGNVYPVVQIGSQCWLAENVKCAHSPITNSNIVNHQGLADGSYFKTRHGKSAHWYHNDPATYESLNYGLLYNYCAAMDFYNNDEFSTNAVTGWDASSKVNSPHRGICPKGWHIPTNDEWTTLKNNENANQAVKLVGDGWPAESQSGGYCSAPCPCGTVNHNLSGFSALPAGYVTGNNLDQEKINATYFWSATCNTYCGYAAIGQNSSSLGIQTNGDFRWLHSVRCVRDSE